MLYGQFETLLDAEHYRKNHGGWIFVSDRGEAICRSNKGMNGRLI